MDVALAPNQSLRATLAQLEAFQQTELLQEDRPLAPQAAFADGIAAIVDARRLFDASAVSRQVGIADQAATRLGPGVEIASNGPAVKAVGCQTQAPAAILR